MKQFTSKGFIYINSIQLRGEQFVARVNVLRQIRQSGQSGLKLGPPPLPRPPHRPALRAASQPAAHPLTFHEFLFYRVLVNSRQAQSAFIVVIYNNNEIQENI